jgi:2-polyprenyl-3-methyl-5-hydroxy-6-metoxy-1,4-benzoquinol methylase
MVTQQAPQLDEAKLQAFMGRVVGDFGATLSTALAVIGDRLGLYKALAAAGPLSAAELAAHTGTSERYVREWLINQAAGGYVEYDAATGRFSLPPEQAAALADESGPYFMGGGFQLVSAMIAAEPRIRTAFRTGEGMGWGEHDAGLFEGTERFFRPGYLGNLVGAWIPALDGVEEKLRRGCSVADIGCGHGAATIIMAQAFPASRFWGFDSHAPSIARARQAAAEAGVAARARFEVADAVTYPAPLSGYDLIAHFDCLHDMGDPVGACTHALRSLAADGTVLIVEPMAGERIEENFNPVGRVFSGASTLCCTPNALAQGGAALGTIATEAQLRAVVTSAGFTRFRRAAQTPVNRVFEARP